MERRGESNSRDGVDRLVRGLEEKYRHIEDAKGVIATYQGRADSTCGPVTQAQHNIERARLTIESAEGYIKFIHDWSETDDKRIDPTVPRAALAEVARRRMTRYDDIAH